MAIITMRANLSSAQYPFATELWGRSIIIPQYDQNFDRTALNVTGIVLDKGIPQVFYMHNCMPTPQGYQSIGYSTILNGINALDFDNALPIVLSDGNKVVFSPAAGKNYVYDAPVGTWKSISPFPQGTVRDDVQVTVAYIHSNTYICYSQYNIYQYDDVGKVLTPVALAGLVTSLVKGVCSANGYMIVWDDKTVYWSSQTTETDFVPSLATGSGSGSVNEAKGKIIVCLPIVGGFLIYCQNNVVAAKYSGNVNFPFIFKEVPDSSGINTLDQVSWQANMPQHYIWSGNGLQSINLISSSLIYPEATDFLANKLFEDFDETTLTFTSQYLSTPLYSKITVVEARFLVISYGISYPDFSHALVMDLLLNRWGKLKIAHRDCFEWNFPNLYGNLTYGQLGGITYGQLGLHTTYGDLSTAVVNQPIFKQALAFLQQDGTVKTVVFEFSESQSDGVLVLGKFQLARNNMVVHQSTEVETVNDINTFKSYTMVSYDGKTLQPPVVDFLAEKESRVRTYKKMLVGANFSKLFIGQFNMNTVLLTMTLGPDNL